MAETPKNAVKNASNSKFLVLTVRSGSGGGGFQFKEHIGDAELDDMTSINNLLSTTNDQSLARSRDGRRPITRQEISRGTNRSAGRRSRDPGY